MLKKVRNRIDAMLGRAVLSALESDSGGRRLLQIYIDEHDTRDGVEFIQPYGHAASPPKRCEAFYMQLEGRRGHTVVHMLVDPERPALEDGDSALYSDNARIITHSDGRITVQAKGDVEVESGGNVTVSAKGNAEVSATVATVDAESINLKAQIMNIDAQLFINGEPYELHGHSGVTPGNSTSGPLA